MVAKEQGTEGIRIGTVAERFAPAAGIHSGMGETP